MFVPPTTMVCWPEPLPTPEALVPAAIEDGVATQASFAAAPTDGT